MKQTVNFNDFREAFRQAGRLEQFSYEGLKALFDYLEQLEAETEQEIELDVIALCCEYTEYANLSDYNKDYCEECEECEDVSDVSNNTTVIETDGEAFIIHNY